MRLATFHGNAFELNFDSRNGKNKKQVVVFFIVLFILYTVCASIRPFEDDESQYIRAGVAMVQGELDPFKVAYYKHYSNPFQYIVGSPLVPSIYGLSYIFGGIFLVRMTASLSVLLSIFIAYRLIQKSKGSPTLPLVLMGFSSSTIMLASNGLLDSLALLFLMSSLYCIHEKRMFLGGILSALAMTSKFILIIPVFIMWVFVGLHYFKKEWLRYLLGILLIILPFLVAYRELIPVLVDFLMVAKLNATTVHLLAVFLQVFLLGLPIASVVVLVYAVTKTKTIKKNVLFFIPVVSIILYQVLLLDYSSFMRHLPYAEFSAAIVLSAVLAKKKVRFLGLIALVFVGLSVGVALKNISDYPSYNLIQEDLKGINGTVLALNINSYILIQDLPMNATAKEVYNYYYFNYDDLHDSKVVEYENALKEGFFDYATVPSYSSGRVIRYEEIETLIRKHYCLQTSSTRPNGIDVYKRCPWTPTTPNLL